MEELANQKCVACDRGAPKADDGLIHQFLQTSDDWDLVKEDDIPKLMRIYKFNNLGRNRYFFCGFLAKNQYERYDVQ